MQKIPSKKKLVAKKREVEGQCSLQKNFYIYLKVKEGWNNCTQPKKQRYTYKVWWWKYKHQPFKHHAQPGLCIGWLWGWTSSCWSCLTINYHLLMTFLWQKTELKSDVSVSHEDSHLLLWRLSITRTTADKMIKMLLLTMSMTIIAYSFLSKKNKRSCFHKSQAANRSKALLHTQIRPPKPSSILLGLKGIPIFSFSFVCRWFRTCMGTWAD